jgi:hypothetical protein
MSSLRLLRLSTIGLGGALCAFGLFEYIDRTSPGIQEGIDVLVWLAAATTLHDGLLSPLVLTAGLLIVKLKRFSGIVRGGLLCAVCLTLVALPVMLRGDKSANPTVLPLDYVRNWAVVMAVTMIVTAGLAWSSHRRARGTQSTDSTNRPVPPRLP